MVAKPKKLKIRLIILIIILSLTEQVNTIPTSLSEQLARAQGIIDNANSDASLWSTPLKSLSDYVESIEPDFKANNLTTGEMETIADTLENMMDNL